MLKMKIKHGQSLAIGDDIKITVLGKDTKLGIEAPSKYSFTRDFDYGSVLKNDAEALEKANKLTVEQQLRK